MMTVHPPLFLNWDTQAILQLVSGGAHLLCFLPILPAQLLPNLHSGDVPDSQGRIGL